jgi:hypothetical protein
MLNPHTFESGQEVDGPDIGAMIGDLLYLDTVKSR